MFDPQKAPEYLASIDVKISQVKGQILSLKEEKLNLQKRINLAKERNKIIVNQIQDDINKTRLLVSKKQKRERKKREQESFQRQLAGHKRDMERLNERILNKQKDLNELATIKKKIRLEVKVRS